MIYAAERESERVQARRVEYHAEMVARERTVEVFR